jgi:S-adenosylmethionine:tRNA ribosyltransferase-isomerase
MLPVLTDAKQSFSPADWRTIHEASLDFELADQLEASEPPEARGMRRDQVRLMVSRFPGEHIEHACFSDLAEFLEAGDVLAINTSGTMNAALPATGAGGISYELHLSTHLPGDLWVVELRWPVNKGTISFYSAVTGERFSLPGGAEATLLLPYRSEQRSPGSDGSPVRLWLSHLQTPEPIESYLERYGFPIRYSYVRRGWPLEYYQTVYATQRGSAEMPSAGRAFTNEMITRLVTKGVQIAPLILHTGVASLEEGELPYEEYYRVPSQTARLVNQAHRDGQRVIAVGTTSVRALETVTDASGEIHPGEGWTDLVISPERGIRLVDGLLTGFHEPKSSHLAMLAALAGYEHLKLTYAEAIARGYLWHEFGDLHLLLPAAWSGG